MSYTAITNNVPQSVKSNSLLTMALLILFSLVQDFLSNRKQHILVNGCKSKIYDVTSGVLQGSVLGPLLFVIYINLLVEKSGLKDLFLYADNL